MCGGDVRLRGGVVVVFFSGRSAGEVDAVAIQKRRVK